MSLLFRIVYAAHANGTHHKLALDALRKLEGPDAEGWRRLFLSTAEAYMTASKLPDTEFKDFKNHVLHVREGFWGGAADKCEEWYQRLVNELAGARWPEAVHAAGILGHYFVDPIHPFHTGQSEAENNIHRAVEWSISRSYDELLAIGEATAPDAGPSVGSGPGWLHDAVVSGAEKGNRYYEALMTHYDFHRGVVDPQAGLDAVAKRFIGELLVFASTGLARVLQRAFAESGAKPPEVTLAVETVLASLRVPVKFVTKKLANAADRRAVEAMYDELLATGKVDKTLGEDERTVRTLYAAEVAKPAEAHRGKRRDVPMVEPEPSPKPAVPRVTRVRYEAAFPPAAAYRLPEATVEAPASTASASHSDAMRHPRAYLSLTDDIERAPSIGPRTAERLQAIGLRTVQDLLAAEPAAVADGLGVRGIDATVITTWQQQARLVLEVPGLRGTHAQLLVGAGFADRTGIVGADTRDLGARVLAFAATLEGRRILRDRDPPTMESIKSWVDTARQAVAA